MLPQSFHSCCHGLQVMKHTPHIFLSGAEVEAFAVQQGHTLVDNASFTTEQRRQQWQRQKDEDKLAPADEIVQQHVHNEVQQQQQQQEPRHGQADDGDRHCQTVGAVAIDSSGRLAAATSTGGRTNKVSSRHRRQLQHTVVHVLWLCRPGATWQKWS